MTDDLAKIGSKDFTLDTPVVRENVTKAKVTDLICIMYNEEGKAVEGYMALEVGGVKNQLRFEGDDLKEVKRLDIPGLIKCKNNNLK